MNPYEKAQLDPAPADFGAAKPASRQSGGLALLFAGAAIFAVGCGGGLLAGFVGARLSGAGMFMGSDFAFEPVEASIAVTLPDTVTPNEPFDLVVTVSDTSGIDRTIATIDISEALADLCDLQPVTPETISINDDYGYDEYEYYTTLPANGSLDFTFTATAKAQGSHRGVVSVYFEDFRSVSRPVIVNAETPGAGAQED